MFVSALRCNNECKLILRVYVRNLFFWLVSDFRFRSEEFATLASGADVANELLYDSFTEKGTASF